jgi:hypothetical protein
MTLKIGFQQRPVMTNFLLDSISLFIARRTDGAPIDRPGASQAALRSPAANHAGHGEDFAAARLDHEQQAADAQLPLASYPVLRDEVTPPDVRRSRTLNLLRSATGVAVTSRVLPAAHPRTTRPHESGQFPLFLTEPEKVRLQIMQVQLRLTSLSFYDGPIDGNLNPETVTGVRYFQTLKGMRSSGTLAAGTLSALGVPPIH